MPLAERELSARATRIEALLGEIEAVPDPALRDRMMDVVVGVVSLYGEGLTRILAIMERQTGQAQAGALLDALAGDELVSHLLLLHDLHPIPVEVRVTRALDMVRPYLESHGGNVELLGVEGGIARLRLQGSCNGCPSSTLTLKSAIEAAIKDAAPDLDGIDAEGTVEPSRPDPAFIPGATITRYQHCPAGIENGGISDPHAPTMERRHG
ncbi:MAG: NifU family protein [Chloroflexota bacterium]